MIPPSYPFARQYRLLYFMLISCIIIGMAFYLYSAENPRSHLFFLFQTLFFCYILWKRRLLLKQMSYDSEYLYVRERQQEEVITLQAIARIELKTPGGGWDIYFKGNYMRRESLIFIPSLFYPLNFKKIDARYEAFEKNLQAGKRKSNTQGYCFFLFIF